MLAFGGGATVRYTTAEAFTNHFLTALGIRSVDAFKQTYRDADVLLIDDVQFLASKARTEEEFFHTFNALYETGGSWCSPAIAYRERWYRSSSACASASRPAWSPTSSPRTSPPGWRSSASGPRSTASRWPTPRCWS